MNIQKFLFTTALAFGISFSLTTYSSAQMGADIEGMPDDINTHSIDAERDADTDIFKEEVLAENGEYMTEKEALERDLSYTHIGKDVDIDSIDFDKMYDGSQNSVGGSQPRGGAPDSTRQPSRHLSSTRNPQQPGNIPAVVTIKNPKTGKLIHIPTTIKIRR